MNFKPIFIAFVALCLVNVGQYADARVASGRSVIENHIKACEEIGRKWGNGEIGKCECTYDDLRNPDNQYSICRNSGITTVPGHAGEFAAISDEQGCQNSGGTFAGACNCGSGKTYDIYSQECITSADVVKSVAQRWQEDCKKLGGEWHNGGLGVERRCECNRNDQRNPAPKYAICRRFNIIRFQSDSDDSRPLSQNGSDSARNHQEHTADELEFIRAFNELTNVFIKKVKEANQNSNIQ